MLHLAHRMVFPSAAAMLRHGDADRDLGSALDRARSVEGLLFGREPEALFRLADDALSNAGCPAAIIEIGSFRGKSTVLLASAARRHRGIVVCVDPFTGAMVPGAAHVPDTYAAFAANVADFIDDGSVRPVRLPSDDAVEEVRRAVGGRPVGMVFIDGLHTRDQVGRDFEHYFPFLVEGGVLAFHDTMGSHAGPTHLAIELAGRDARLRDFNAVCTLTYCRRGRRSPGDSWRTLIYRTVATTQARMNRAREGQVP